MNKTESAALGGLWAKADDSEKEYINTLLADQLTLNFLFEKLRSVGVTREEINELRLQEKA